MGYLTWYGSKIEGDCFLTALEKDLAGIVSHISIETSTLGYHCCRELMICGNSIPPYLAMVTFTR